jgi:hypothetical protein
MGRCPWASRMCGDFWYRCSLINLFLKKLSILGLRARLRGRTLALHERDAGFYPSSTKKIMKSLKF